MDTIQEEKKREEFRTILLELANLEFPLIDGSSRSKIYQRFEKLYYPADGEDRFRHFYSDVFSVLTFIHQDDGLGSIEILGQNLGAIRQGYQAKNKDSQGNPIDIHDELKKLYDHVSLDIARINYSDGADRKVEQTASIAQIKSQVAQVQSKIELAKQDLDSQVDTVRKAVQEAQKEYITILGIFASIVLAFTAGIAFSTSVLENMHQVSVYRVVLVVLLIGLVLTNILYGLFYYIGKLVRPQGEKVIKPLWITNAILIILLLATCGAWLFGVIEKRDSHINSGNETVTWSEYDTDMCVTTDTIPDAIE